MAKAVETFIGRCENCGAKDRIPGPRLAERALCGKCGKPPPSSGSYPELARLISDASFRKEVLDFSGPVVVNFHSPTCPYCRRFDATFQQLVSKYAGRIKFTKIVREQNPITASRLGVQGVPTLLLFREGVLKDRTVGLLPEADVEAHLMRILEGAA